MELLAHSQRSDSALGSKKRKQKKKTARTTRTIYGRIGRTTSELFKKPRSDRTNSRQTYGVMVRKKNMKLFNKKKLRELLAEYKQVRKQQANEPYATTSENAFYAYKVSLANYCILREKAYNIMAEYCRITGTPYKSYIL